MEKIIYTLGFLATFLAALGLEIPADSYYKKYARASVAPEMYPAISNGGIQLKPFNWRENLEDSTWLSPNRKAPYVRKNWYKSGLSSRFGGDDQSSLDEDLPQKSSYLFKIGDLKRLFGVREPAQAGARENRWIAGIQPGFGGNDQIFGRLASFNRKNQGVSGVSRHLGDDGERVASPVADDPQVNSRGFTFNPLKWGGNLIDDFLWVFNDRQTPYVGRRDRDSEQRFAKAGESVSSPGADYPKVNSRGFNMDPSDFVWHFNDRQTPYKSPWVTVSGSRFGKAGESVGSPVADAPQIKSRGYTWNPSKGNSDDFDWPLNGRLIPYTGKNRWISRRFGEDEENAASSVADLYEIDTRGITLNPFTWGANLIDDFVWLFSDRESSLIGDRPGKEKEKINIVNVNADPIPCGTLECTQ